MSQFHRSVDTTVQTNLQAVVVSCCRGRDIASPVKISAGYTANIPEKFDICVRHQIRVEECYVSQQ